MLLAISEQLLPPSALVQILKYGSDRSMQVRCRPMPKL